MRRNGNSERSGLLFGPGSICFESVHELSTTHNEVAASTKVVGKFAGSGAVKDENGATIFHPPCKPLVEVVALWDDARTVQTRRLVLDIDEDLMALVFYPTPITQ